MKKFGCILRDFKKLLKGISKRMNIVVRLTLVTNVIVIIRMLWVNVYYFGILKMWQL